MFRTCTLQHSSGRRSSVNRTLSACAIRLANLAGTTEVFEENVLAVLVTTLNPEHRVIGENRQNMTRRIFFYNYDSFTSPDS